MDEDIVLMNRAPVLTLWAGVVAHRQGYDWDAALTFGKAVAGLNAQKKGRMLGIYGPSRNERAGRAPKRTGLGEEFWIEVCGRPVPGKGTEAGPRAVVKDKVIDPRQVKKYLVGKFGDDLERVRQAMEELAQAFGPEELEQVGYSLYERFRPVIDRGKKGWGQKGVLDLDLVRSLAP